MGDPKRGWPISAAVGAEILVRVHHYSLPERQSLANGCPSNANSLRRKHDVNSRN
jgi:hypothetical protein